MKPIERHIICSLGFSYDRLSQDEIQTIKNTKLYKREVHRLKCVKAMEDFRNALLSTWLGRLLIKSVNDLERILRKLDF